MSAKEPGGLVSAYNLILQVVTCLFLMVVFEASWKRSLLLPLGCLLLPYSLVDDS
jgi:hypothetical protein